MLFGKFEESGSWASTLFPETWCAKTYHAIHPDLAEMDDTTLEDHYAQYGKNEGRQSCPVRNRLDFIELLNTIRPALEIGAFDAPLLEQTRVKHFDVLDQAELRKRASELNRNAQTVPYIDYFSAEADLSIVTEKFKLITSSHAIEHTPDLVRHLLDVEKILTADYATLVPGAGEAVEKLRGMGLKIGSTTGYTRSIMERVFPVAAAQGYAPDCCVCSDDLAEGRPGPLQMYQCFIDLKVWPAASVVKVDDTPPGIAEGINAGCLTVGVALSGNIVGRTPQELAVLPAEEVQALRAQATEVMRAAGAQHVIDTVADLPDLLIRLDQSG